MVKQKAISKPKRAPGKSHIGGKTQMQSSEANFKAFLSNSPLGIRIVSENGETLYVNHVFLKIYGFRSLKEFNATPVKDRYTPESYIEFRARRDKRRRKEPLPDNYEVSIVRKNGTVRHLQVLRKEIMWSGKLQYQTIYRDVTEQKQVEEALKLSEERWKTTVGHAPVGIATVNPERRFITANETFCRILGYTEKELQQLTFKDITHPEDIDESVTMMQALDSGKVPLFQLEKRYLKKNGSVINGKVVVNGLRDDAGQVRLYIAELEDITERKQMEEALKLSEQNFRNSIDSSPMGIYITSPAWQTLYANQAFLDIFGYKNIGDITKNPPYTFYTPESNALLEKRREAQKHGASTPAELDVSIQRKDATIRYLHIFRKAVIWNGAEQYQLFYDDITAGKQAQQALIASEVSYRRLFESAKDGILIIDAVSGLITDANPFLYNLLGLSLQEIKGKELWQIGTFADIVSSKERFEELRHKGYTRYEDLPLKTADGRQISVEFVSNVYDVDHRRVIQCNIRDITERKKAEDALYTSEEKYRLIVEKSNDVIFTFNSVEELTYISPSIQNALGYNSSELVGQTFSSLVHPDDVQRLQQVVQRNIKDGIQTPGGNEYRIRHASGEWRWHNASGNAVFDAGGRFVNFVGISRDITERKLISLKLDDLHKTMQLVTDINELIVQIDNEKELLCRACNEFVRSRQYALAWIGFKQAGSYSILPVAQCGEKVDYLAAINITWDNSPLGNGPTGIAIKTGKPDVIQDMVHDPRYEPWKEVALKYGFKAAAAFPLIIQDNVIGVLNVYSAAVEAFNKDEVNLLEELAGDLSLGIEKIRRREEQRKLEEELKLSEQNFRNSLDSSIMGIRIVDTAWHTLYANHVYLDMFGYKNIAEIGRTSLQDHYTPEEKARYRERMARKQRGETVPDNPKVDIIDKDGTVRSIVVYSNAVLWNGQKQTQLIYYDVTEREKAQEALKISEQNFRNSLDSSLIGIRIVDDSGHNIYLNQTFLNFFGYADAAEVESSPPQQHYTPECYTEYLRRGERIAHGEPIPDEYEIDIIRKDGAVRHLQLFRRQVLWNGKTEFQILYNDITERVQAEIGLKASEQNFRNSMDNSSIGIRIMGDADQTLYANQALLDMFGYANIAELNSSPPQAHYTPESRAAFEERQVKFARGEPLQDRLEFDIIRKDGAVRHLQLSSRQIIWNGKQKYQILYNDITDRVEAEKALKLSEHNFRNSLDKSFIGIRISDKQDNNLYANQAMLDIFGYKDLAEIQANPPQNFYTPEYYAGFVIRHQKFLRGEPMPKQIEADIVRKDGTVRNLQISMMEIFWDGKQQYQTLYNDITERKQAEAALKTSEQNFRNSLEHSLIGIRIVDSAWHTLYANQAFLNMFGYANSAEADASTPEKIYTPEEYRHFLEREEKRMRGESLPDTMEIDTRRKDGVVRRIQTTRREILWDGKPQYQIFYNDITERVQAEAALKASEENFRNTLDSSLMGIFIGHSGTVLYVNQAFLEMFGYKNVDEVRATRPVEFYSPESYAQYLAHKGRQKRGDLDLDNFEIDIVRKDGSKRHLQAYRKEVLWDGQLRSQILYNDVTALKQAQEERQRMEDKAQVASRLAVVGEMAAGVAHEINNPLTGVLGFSQMLLEKPNVPEDVKAELRLIVDGSQRVADIVKRLLTFARQTKPVKSVTDINSLIDNTLKLREYVFKTANINVVTCFDPELPWSVVDPGQMQQVFLNIIVNAEQAMKTAHGRGTLTVTTETKGNNIFLSFQDDGPGIKPENMKRLFEPFFTTKAPGEGTGLGLSLSRSIILEHNGRMSVESQFGHGANFVIELPVVESLPSGADSLEHAAKPPAVAAKPGRILVIDDEPGVRILLERVFIQMGHNVDTVADAESAIAKLDDGSVYDIILSDVRMPGMSGIELHAFILKKMPAMRNKIIFITGDVMGADIKDFLMQNNLSYFAKPFDIEALKGKICTMMTAAPGGNNG